MVTTTYDTKNDNLTQTQTLLTGLNKNLSEVNALTESMLITINDGVLSTNRGLSFLEIKYQMLLSYLTNLAYLMLKKNRGKRIESSCCVARLAEIRTVLEKIKPIEYRLKYQIEKLMRSTVSGNAVGNSDPMKFKANPEALDANCNDEENEESRDDEDKDDKTDKKQNNGIYMPPKLAALHYDGNETIQDKMHKAEERSRKRAVSGAILRELKEEYLDTPVEDSIGRERKVHIDLATKRKIEYEENYMTRLPVTKEEKHRNRQVTTLNTLGDEITSFSRPVMSKKRKLKDIKKNKNKNKFKKRRRV